jgi:hypothetical protein
VLLGIAFWASALWVLFFIVPPGSTLQEFRDYWYPVSLTVLASRSPYTIAIPWLLGETQTLTGGFEHSPAVALLVAPFGLLPYSIAEQIWYWLNVGFIALIAICSARHYSTRWPTSVVSGLVMLILVGFAPVRETLRIGQLDIFILLLVVAGIVLSDYPRGGGERTGRDAVAGVLLGVATSLKLYPFGLLLFYLWKRRYRTVISACATLGVLAVMSLIVLGPKATLEYVEVLQLGSGPTYISTPFGFSLAAILYRAFTVTPNAVPVIELPTTLIRVIIIAWTAIIVVVLGRRLSREERHTQPQELCLVVIAILLVFPPLEVSHLTFAAVGALLAWRVFEGELARAGVAEYKKIAVLGLLIGVPLYLGMLRATTRTEDHRIWLTLLLVVVAMAAVTYLLKKSNVPWATSVIWGIMSGALLLFTAPVFMGMSAWWSSSVSGARIFLAGGQLYGLAIFAASCALLLWRAVPQNVARRPEPGALGPLDNGAPVGAGQRAGSRPWERSFEGGLGTPADDVAGAVTPDAREVMVGK